MRVTRLVRAVSSDSIAEINMSVIDHPPGEETLCGRRHKLHLIRAAMRFVSSDDRKRVAAALRPIYTAPTVESAETELLAFAESSLGRKYPAAVATWENAWERFIPFLAFPTRAAQDHLHHG